MVLQLNQLPLLPPSVILEQKVSLHKRAASIQRPGTFSKIRAVLETGLWPAAGDELPQG